MQNANVDEMTETATAIPVQVDYENLEADVAAWRVVFLDNIRQAYGSAEADTAAAQLDANPWLALQWFVEESIPAEQRNAGFVVPQEAVAALEALCEVGNALTDSEEMAEAVAHVADHSPDLKGLEHVGKCMAFLMAQGDFFTRPPRDFEQVAWDKAQGEDFMDGVTREAHAEAFGEFLAAIGRNDLQ